MKQKIYLFTWLLLSQVCMAQLSLTGLVIDGKTGMPLAGANATADKAKQSAKTNAAGAFTLGVSSAVGKLTVALSGYEAQTVEYKLPTEGHLMVYLHEKVTQIEEVALSTGYQKISKERATDLFLRFQERCWISRYLRLFWISWWPLPTALPCQVVRIVGRHIW